MRFFSHPRRVSGSGSQRALTLTEVLISMSIAVTVLGLSTTALLSGMKTMYKDSERLHTNAKLRYFIEHITSKTIGASEFYVLPSYLNLDGTVNLTAVTPTGDLAAPTPPINTPSEDLCYGDCLILVTRSNVVAATANVLKIEIYYRVVSTPASEGQMRYLVRDYGVAGSTTPIATLINGLNVAAAPTTITGSVKLADKVRGRPVNGSSAIQPIFSSTSSGGTPNSENVSLNLELISGTAGNNLLSSSSFNYTISPRR